MRVASARSASQGRVDVVAQDRLRRAHIAGQQSFDSFTKKRLSELGITLDASANRFLEIASQRHD